MYKLGRSFGDTISLSAFIFIDKYYVKNFQIGSYFYQECTDTWLNNESFK